jgi:hypothetical protein
MGEKRNAYNSLVGRSEGKRQLGRPRRRWMDDIKMDLGRILWSDMGWIHLAQDRNHWPAFINAVTELRGP